MDVTFSRAIVNVGNSLVNDGRVVVEIVVELALIEKLGMFSIGLLEFDSNLEVGFDVNPLVYLAESTLVNFTDNFVVFTYFFRHLRHRFK